SRRVEVVFPIEQPNLKQRLIQEVLATTLADNLKARELQSDGSYRRLAPEPNQVRVRSREKFLEIAQQNAASRLQEEQQAPPLPYDKPRKTRANRQPKRQTG